MKVQEVFWRGCADDCPGRANSVPVDLVPLLTIILQARTIRAQLCIGCITCQRTTVPSAVLELLRQRTAHQKQPAIMYMALHEERAPRI